MGDFAKELAALRRATGHRPWVHALNTTGVLRKSTNQLGLRAELARKLEDYNREDLTDEELREIFHATRMSPSEFVKMIDTFLGE